MTGKLAERVAVVTGAGQGLGRSYAIGLAAQGAKVVVNDIGKNDAGTWTAEAVVEEILEAGGDAVANTDSVASGDGGKAIVQAALDHFGSIDILVSNAGIERNKSYAKSDESHWDPVIDVHLNGTHHLCHAAWPHMKERGHGRVILVTSPSGLWGNFSQASYAAAKMGIIGLANVLAIEGKRYGILVNSLAPIATTPMSAHTLPPGLGGKLPPDLVTPAIVKLASDDRARRALETRRTARGSLGPGPRWKCHRAGRAARSRYAERNVLWLSAIHRQHRLAHILEQTAG